MVVAATFAIVGLLTAGSAFADDYFSGEAKGQENSMILVHRDHGQLTQVVLHVQAKCTLDGERTKPSFGYDDLKGIEVRKKRFRKDLRYSAPTTGLEQPSYKWRFYLAGRIFSTSLDLKFETRFIDNHHKQKRRCVSGRQSTELKSISKHRYLGLIAKTPFEPR